MEPVNAAIVYYSSTGTVHALAQAAAEGAEKAGARVRLRKVAETAPPEAISAKPAWGQHLQDTADVAEASLDDLVWADAVLFGTPTRFGNPASQLRAFIDTTGSLWGEGKLADKVYSAFTASITRHGGQESTLLALANTFYHWGGIIVPPGYTDPIQFESGNPYGTSHVAGDGPPGDIALQAARHQARRVVDTAAALQAGRPCSTSRSSRLVQVRQTHPLPRLTDWLQRVNCHRAGHIDRLACEIDSAAPSNVGRVQVFPVAIRILRGNADGLGSTGMERRRHGESLVIHGYFGHPAVADLHNAINTAAFDHRR